MADVFFRKENGDTFTFPAQEQDGTARATAIVRSWAVLNGFKRVSFIVRDDEPLRFNVQIDDDPPLNSWVDGALVAEGRTQELENYLDFARGEHRRRAAGYERYDR